MLCNRLRFSCPGFLLRCCWAWRSSPCWLGQLAAFHGVDVQRVVLAASASEFIFRITAMVVGRGGSSVGLPPHSYGDYAHAAFAHGLKVVDADVADLCWVCEPSSPLGQAHVDWLSPRSVVQVLDRAYELLRSSGYFVHSDDLNRLWQLYSPNKALGLTCVRAAYANAPLLWIARQTLKA